jgi:K+ transporter
VLGAVSIAVWTLVIIIAVKYVVFVMRADNEGEGGILALTALVSPESGARRPGSEPAGQGEPPAPTDAEPSGHRGRRRTRSTGTLVLLGLLGTALLFGDGMVTPAISVLSAVEGLKVAQPSLDHFVLPIAVVIIVGLFAIQRFGTGAVGKVFGPVMVLWFLTMTVLGVVSLFHTPAALQALNPINGVHYFAANRFKGFLSMGSLFLVVTGGEALYADLGHFGRRPIELSWFSTVLPSACIGLMIGFGSSANLAAAYGLAVTGTMFITTILFAVYARRTFGWSRVVVWTAAGVVLVIESAFLVANLFKIPQGGWFPLVIAAVVVTVLTTWKTGRQLVRDLLRGTMPLAAFAASLGEKGQKVVRVDGTAVFLYSDPGITPPSLLAHVRASGALQRDVLVVSVVIASVPTVPPVEREEVTDCGNGVRKVTLHYGFMESIYVADDLQLRVSIDPAITDYFLGRERVRSTERPGMARWRERLFAILARNASDVAAHYHLPDERVVEIGLRLDL